MQNENEKPYKLECGVMEKILPGVFPDNTFDSIVTDPPYGIKFMGKRWDYQVPTVKQWEAAYNALKPGGYLVAFGGSRTSHRMAVNIEDAGFEIRDTMMWIYSQGFPKSMDVSKAIDKAKGAEREVIGIKPGHKEFANRKTSGDSKFKDGMDRPWMHNEEARQKYHMATAPTTDLAKQWNGWGTALKPAYEPIIIARKPLDGTVAENIEKWGVGGISIDECRVSMLECSDIGRFPANVLHDGSEDVLELFPESKGQLGKASQSLNAAKNKIYGKNKNFTNNPEPRLDSGNAARFFYCAKATNQDRNEGMGEDKNTHPTVKPVSLMRYLVRLVTPKNGVILDPFMGSGSTGKAAILEGFAFIGIDQDEACIPVATKRIDSVLMSSI